jgi:ATP-dependent Lhr-like helicase
VEARVSSSLDLFSPIGRAWFESAFDAPTDVQERGWPSIASGGHTLLCAPTGSGKTLAAFFWCLDRLASEPRPPRQEHNLSRRRDPATACSLLYVSPLKALAFDVEKNLRAPLRGLSIEAARRGLPIPEIDVGIRTGDTSSTERRQMERHPPDILITTPESLFLILTSAARAMLDSVRWIILDEIHTMAGSKRGAHLAISLERLTARNAVEPQRIGLSATQNPLEEVGRYLGGVGRDVSIIDAGQRKVLQLTVEVPVPNMADPSWGDIGQQPASAGGAARESNNGKVSTPIGITTEIAAARPWARTQREAEIQATGASLPRRSIWPAIYPRLLALVRAHRSTIIFCNSRRMAERIAAKLNEMAEEELVRAHHGSVSREQRLIVEDLLKSGALPALVATSSLELGIDMGAVDLVIQIGSPPSVASGLQRIGRAGHSVGEPSTGAIFPTHLGDLLQAATITKLMVEGAIEKTQVPRNPLDILAQQIVAMTALDEWDLAQLRAVISRAYPFAELGDRAFEATLDMLDGRYPSEEFAELRPRIVWDRATDVVRGRAGAHRLAVTSGGTIPDRGLFSVNMFGDGNRVGELDEEMVYELRVGEVFLLGATSWKVVEITQSQVRVTPAPGEPGKITFWHGDALARPVEVGRALGGLTRTILSLPESQAEDYLREQTLCEHYAATNLVAYVHEQSAHAGVVPDDRTIVVEKFRDQLGDWRVCVLTPFGARVHTPWALAIEARLSERMGLDVQSIYSDDGFAFRIIDAESAPGAEELMLDAEEVREAVTQQLHGSALFASRFRENAARALLLPRQRPGSRTPLWLQRQKSADLLRIAMKYPSFPVLAETFRECLTDVFDLSALADIMRRVASREIRVAEVQTELPSPFASSLVFDYVAQYMYEGDLPMAERRAQALTLDTALLNELLGSEDIRELLDPEAIALTELELQGLLPDRFPRDVDEAVDVFRRVGDLSQEESDARGISAEWLLEAEVTHRLIRTRIGGVERWIAADDAALYRDGLGVTLPVGVAEAYLRDVDAPLVGLVRRFARTHVPFEAGQIVSRWKLPATTVLEVLHPLISTGDVVAGQFQPRAGGQEYCSSEVLKTLRRRSLASLRREVEPVSPAALARFTPAWQGVGSDGTGVDRLAEILIQLQGAPLPVSVLERDILAARMRDYAPQLLDTLISSGTFVWVGAGALGTKDGRVGLFPRAELHRFDPPAADTPANELHEVIRERLARGACFFPDIHAASGFQDTERVLDALWDLVWAGQVTNDTYAPLRFVGPSPVRRRGHRGLGPPRSLGRWSLVADLASPASSPTEQAFTRVETLLNRYGVLTREHALAESVPGGFVNLYALLRTMEESGRIRRGYFVEGLGGAQFALPGAVERLRGQREDNNEVVLLSTVDPANMYGVTVSWPDMAGRPARIAGAYVILRGGHLRVFVERGGRSLFTHGEVQQEEVACLLQIARRLGKLEIQRIDGQPMTQSALLPRLEEAGFVPTHRGVVVYGDRRGRR